MNRRKWLVFGLLAMLAGIATPIQSRQEKLFKVDLAYRGRGNGPSPNFSPKGTQVPLTDLAAGANLPSGAVRPAKSGIIKVGPNEKSWIPVLAAADAGHPSDLCLIYVDRNRNGNFADDGPPVSTTPTLNEKTRAWWSSFSPMELSIPYGRGSQEEIVEPYMVSVWIVRETESAPDILRYSVASWRSGTISVNGIDALVAAMDSNNDAIFDKKDNWSLLAAAAPNAAKQVLSISEAMPTGRLMFLPAGDKELVFEFRNFSPDGRWLTFALVDRPVTKAEDRKGDDTVGAERSRPRAQTPFPWNHGNFESSVAKAKAAGRKLIIDFETTWCGPCKMMDEWVWSDAEVAAVLNGGFVGVKLDGDVEKDLVKRFAVAGYPTVLVLDVSGGEPLRFVGYRSSKEVLDFLKR
jgi:thiol-disulfide isomerase/thioredoxin